VIINNRIQCGNICDGQPAWLVWIAFIVDNLAAIYNNPLIRNTRSAKVVTEARADPFWDYDYFFSH
jgi:hypothetical protein